MTNLKTYFKELFEADNFKARSKESVTKDRSPPLFTVTINSKK